MLFCDEDEVVVVERGVSVWFLMNLRMLRILLNDLMIYGNCN
jgi:hypothetical protein